MAKYDEKLAEDLDLEEGLGEFDDLEEDDYIFVIKGDGTLKNVIFPPEVDFEYSEKILEIFRIIGINDPDALLGDRTLH
jgi:hypothetical protein